MDSSMSNFIYALLFSFSAFVVVSQQNINSPPPGFSAPTSPPPSPPVWWLTQPPPPPVWWLPPPLSPPITYFSPPWYITPTLSPPPPTQSPPPPTLSPPPPSPRKHLRSPPPEVNHGDRSISNHDDAGGNLSPPRRNEGLNTGEIIGLMFLGVVAVMQVCVLAFLVIRRRQLFKA